MLPRQPRMQVEQARQKLLHRRKLRPHVVPKGTGEQTDQFQAGVFGQHEQPHSARRTRRHEGAQVGFVVVPVGVLLAGVGGGGEGQNRHGCLHYG